MDSQSGKEIITHYEKFLVCFFSLLQAIKIHDDNNRLVVDGIRKFKENFARCLEEDSLTIKASKGFFFGDEKLPYTKKTKNLVDNMVHFFEARNLEALCFYSDIEQASSRDILLFMRGLETAGHEEDPIAWLTDILDINSLTWVAIIPKPKTEEEEEEAGAGEDEIEHMRRERAKKDYTYVLASLQEVAKKVSEGKRVGIRKTIRVVQDIVAHIVEDDELYSAISTLRIFDDYTFTHSVNVAILSMCIGKQVNFSRRTLERIGICALFHDLGKIEVPQEILNKPGKLDDTEFNLLQKHSLNSARLIVKLRASRDRKAKILLPPFEHHLKYNLSGYPFSNWKKPLTLFGRIIAIADVYDAITSERVYRKSAMSPDRALGLMLEGAGRDFDPILIKVFINMLGVYPVGTLLKLDTGDLALVVSTSRKKGERRPVVCLMERTPDGNYRKGQTLDLSERDSGPGNYVRGVIETYHPSAFGIQPVQHIFA